MSDSNTGPFWGGFATGMVILGIVLGIVGGCNYLSGVQIDSGHVGVESSWGQIQKQPLLPGYYHFWLFSGINITDISTQPQNYHFPEINAATKELQTVKVDVSVNYDIPQESATTLVINGGVDHILKQRMLPALQDVVKESTTRYTMAPGPDNILSHRPDLRTSIKTLLNTDVSQYGLNITDIQITNIDPDPAYSKAIEAAALAQQDLVKAQNESAAKVAAAQGDAQAAALRNQTLTQQQLQYMELQNQQAAIAKWKGDVPNTLVANGGSNDPISLIFGNTAPVK